MKRFLFVVLLAVLLTSCQPKPTFTQLADRARGLCPLSMVCGMHREGAPTIKELANRAREITP